MRRSQFTSPPGVDVDADGNVFVTDFGNDRGVVYEEDSGYFTQFGVGELNGPDSVAVDGEGNVCIAETLNKRVVRYVPANPARRKARRRRQRESGTRRAARAGT